MGRKLLLHPDEIVADDADQRQADDQQEPDNLVHAGEFVLEDVDQRPDPDNKAADGEDAPTDHREHRQNTGFHHYVTS